MRRHHRLLLTIPCLVVALAACGDDEAPVTTTSAPTTTAPTTVAAAPPTSAPAGQTSTSVPIPDAPTSHLVAVRVSDHDGNDRVTFEFDNGIPGYSAGYVPEPVLSDGEGKPIEVAGDAALQVVLANASTADLGGGGVKRFYNGPDRFSPPAARHVRELVRTGDFEARLTWAVGVDGRKPFTVSTIVSPPQVVVDIG